MPQLWWGRLFLLALWSCCQTPCASRQEGRAPGDKLKGAEGRDSGRPNVLAPSIAPELEFLSGLAGRNRLWVIVAPSHTDHYLRMMEKQIQDMEPKGLSCHLAVRDTLVVTVIQNAMMEATLRRTTPEGEATVEPVDPDSATELLHHLELQDRAFAMLILRKDLKVSERFPYAVRVAAVLEAIDQLPARKLERLTGKGSPTKCASAKKKPPPRKKVQRKGLGTLGKGNSAHGIPGQRKPLDKKAALRNKVQDILSGRSRFVIRKTPSSPKGPLFSAPHGTNGERGAGGTPEHRKQRTGERDSTLRQGEGRGEPSPDVVQGGDESTGSSGPSKAEPKKKGKKKNRKGKKGNGGGKKSQRDAAEEERKALKRFLEKLQGRRMLLIAAPSKDASQFLQQRAVNEDNRCDFALRNVSVVAILGQEHNGTLSLQHYTTTDEESSFSSPVEESASPDLILQLRKEYRLHPTEFSMVLTDFDLKSQFQDVFDTPLTAPVILAYVDSFPSQRTGSERARGVTGGCSKLADQGGNRNSLLRFMSKRRLLIISTPSEDEYTFQQQLQALTGQSCPLGIRHFAVLKLVGAGLPASGTVELFPLNGKTQSEKESLSQDVVNRLRDQLKINPEYFSVVVVGKDGDVKAWFPSPLWSLSNIYDLVDSMELRQQEEKLQSTLGIGCPEDTSDGYQGFQNAGDDGYLYL